jgi:hypothetical protein
MVVIKDDLDHLKKILQAAVAQMSDPVSEPGSYPTSPKCSGFRINNPAKDMVIFIL